MLLNTDTLTNTNTYSLFNAGVEQKLTKQMLWHFYICNIHLWREVFLAICLGSSGSNRSVCSRLYSQRASETEENVSLCDECMQQLADTVVVVCIEICQWQSFASGFESPYPALINNRSNDYNVKGGRFHWQTHRKQSPAQLPIAIWRVLACCFSFTTYNLTVK